MSETLAATRIVWLDDLDLSPILQGWESAKRCRSVTGGPLIIAGREFARGVGTHTVSHCVVRLAGGSTRFQAWAGVDDAVGVGRMVFQVRGDGRLLFDSGIVVGREEARRVDLDVTGVELLELFVDAVNDVTHHGHANWADACFTVVGESPQIIPRPREEAVILTPLPGPEPRINGARVIGARPGAPFRFTIPATGERPMTFAAEGLPGGLACDGETGQITGRVADAGTWEVILHARNAHGEATRSLAIVIGEQLCLTPPMGWNSWNVCGPGVTAEDARQTAHALLDSGLAQVGYSYVCIDDGWQGARTRESAIPYALQANEKFPDMAGLVEEIHALGLRAGIYSVPQVYSCAGYPGGSADTPDGRVEQGWHHGQDSVIGAYHFAREDARQYAAWGFDYLKYDAHPSAEDAHEIREALDATGRDIALSLSANYGPEEIEACRPYAQCWRTTGDLIDTWFSVRAKFRAQRRYQGLGRPGGWNDPDMLVVGQVGPGWNAPLGPTRLSPNEQYLHITMWAMLNAPLLIGGDLTQLDAFTRRLLTNVELIDVHQDALGQAARFVVANEEDQTEVWRKELAGGDLAVALVNLGEAAADIAVTWEALGLSGPRHVRDLWRWEDLGVCERTLTAHVPAHGVAAFRLRAPYSI